MKRQNLFPAIVLMGFGLYFFLGKTTFPLPAQIFQWPTLLIIIGLAFLFQAYSGKEYGFILPGVLFTGLGVHYHLINYWNIRPDVIGIIILLISLGYFLNYQKARAGLFYGWLFLALAFFQLFHEWIMQWPGLAPLNWNSINSLWPIVVFLTGAYIFFFKRK